MDLTAIVAKGQARIEAAKNAEQATWGHQWATLLINLFDAVPDEMHELLSYDDTEPHSWENFVNLAAFPTVPIRVNLHNGNPSYSVRVPLQVSFSFDRLPGDDLAERVYRIDYAWTTPHNDPYVAIAQAHDTVEEEALMQAQLIAEQAAWAHEFQAMQEQADESAPFDHFFDYLAAAAQAIQKPEDERETQYAIGLALVGILQTMQNRKA